MSKRIRYQVIMDKDPYETITLADIEKFLADAKSFGISPKAMVGFQSVDPYIVSNHLMVERVEEVE